MSQIAVFARKVVRKLRQTFQYKQAMTETTSPEMSSPEATLADIAEEPQLDAGQEILNLLKQLRQRSELYVSIPLWASEGFHIAIDGYRQGQNPDFPSNINEVNMTTSIVKKSPPEAAQEALRLLKYLRQHRELHLHMHLWGSAGFHLTIDDHQHVPTSDEVNKPFLPNLFLVGAAKSSTTTLHRYLSQIPALCMSNPKEPFFFEYEYELGLAHYQQKYFSHWAGEANLGESRHRNLYLPYIAERIYQLNPAAKIIAVVRNPVDRAYSHWWHWYSRGIDKLEFQDAIKVDYERIQQNRTQTAEDIKDIYYATFENSWDRGPYRTYLDSGYYYEQIERYRAYFPDEQIKIMFFSDLKENPLAFLQALQSFIGIDYYTESNFQVLHENAAIKRQEQPRMDPEIRQWLIDHYREHNQALEAYTGRDLTSWYEA